MAGFRNMPRLSTWLAAAALCAGIACSGGEGTPDTDVIDDVPVEDTINEDMVTVQDTDERDNSTLDDFVEPDVVDQTALDLVAQGKEMLSAGESLSALDTFARALEIEPGLADAQWGMVLGRFQSMVSMYSSLAGLINFKDDPDAVPPATVRSLTWADHDGTLGATIDALWYAAADQQERIDALKALPDTTFNLPGGLPLAFRDDPMMNLCCDWDAGDVYGISSFNNLMLAFISFMGSQNIDVNFAELEQAFKNAPSIENALIETLEKYPDAFTLNPETGAAMWTATKGFLLASTGDALESARLMGLAGDVTGAVATLTSDEHPHLELHGTFPNGADSMEFLWDGTNASLKDVVERANIHLGGATDTQLSLDADVLVAISVLVDILNRTVGIETVLSSLGITLPDIATGLLGSLDKNDPEQLASMLPGMTSLLGIPSGTIYLDVASFLDNPFNLRDFFPNSVTSPTLGSAFTRSFECVRAGTTYAEVDAAKMLTFWVHDPKLETAPTLNIITSPSNPPTAVITDGMDLPLTPLLGFTGLYVGEIHLTTGDAATDPLDDTLNLPPDGGLQTTYTWDHDGGGGIIFGGSWAEWPNPWTYGAACTDDQTPWDSGHFVETEFADAVEINAPGQSTPIAPIAADGKQTKSGFMAFKSPSFNGLLWLKDGENMAPTDQASFAGLFAGILKALEAF